jgi:hypothetical protein
MLCRAKASSVSQVGRDLPAVSVLFSFVGGISFPGVLSAGGSLVANRRLPRLLFVYTPTDVTSPQGAYGGARCVHDSIAIF